MNQEDFARAVLAKYEALDFRPVDTPMHVGAPPLVPREGAATDWATLDFMMFIGDLT